MYCELREGLALSGASTAVPTPASSDCSSRGPYAASLSSQPFAKARPVRTVLHRSEASQQQQQQQQQQQIADRDVAVSSTSGVGRKAISPTRSRTSRTATRGNSPLRSQPSEEASRNGGPAVVRSRSLGKSVGSRSSPQSPERAPSISPIRSGSPSAVQGSRQRSVSNARTQVSQLEQQLKVSESARADLEKQLREERECATADRAKLARLGARLSNLENTREVSARLLEDNRVLREQFEVQGQQMQDLRKEIEKLRGAAPPPTVVLSSSQERLLEENARLRQELQESQVMLAKYTDELNQIMPGVELILTQYQKDNQKGSLSEAMAAQLQQHVESQIDQREGGLYSASPSFYELPPAPFPTATSSQQSEPRTAHAVEASAPRERPAGKGARAPNARARSNGKNRHASLSPQPTYARAPPPALRSSCLRQGSRSR